GLDTNPGTEAQPFKNLSTAHARAIAGTTIWVKPGTYALPTFVNLLKNGSAATPFKVFAVPGPRPVLDFALQRRGDSTARGIAIKGNYWHIRGIDVINAGDNCIHISGSHNTVENVVTHGCDDTGIQITADGAFVNDPTRAAHNTILNCDSYGNYDSVTGGENADGFAAKLYIGPGNVFRGCRAWNNSDDGWDFYASNDVVIVDGCWAFMNGRTPTGQTNPNGDGNGFKLGGAPTAGDVNMGGAIHVVTKSFAFENMACGFVRNNNPSVPMLSMCGGRMNTKGDYCSLTNSSAAPAFTMTGAQAKAIARNPDGSLPAVQ
ncbi:MAG: right-handed parallel beta-helix repeat-containing protein, partial [Deltaproteobacteria bacterium]|nr:right-handed parallel beta-helix repeat-containing protein [Deltaproteobacteria bacterium]